MKKFLLTLLTLILVLAMLVSCAGEQGIQGEKGDKGDKGDTGATGADGRSVKVMSCEKTATDGLVDTYTILFSDGTYTTLSVTNGQSGEKGEAGEPISVVTCEKTATDGFIDTYTITFSDGSIASFTVCNAYELVTVEGVGYDTESDEYTISFSDETKFTFQLPSDAKVLKAYNDASALGFNKSQGEWVVLVIEEACDALLSGGGSVLNPKALASAMSTILSNFDDYFEIETTTNSSEKITITETSGWMSTSGVPAANSGQQNYVYTQKIDVQPGEVVKFVNGSKAVTCRFIVAYSNGSPVDSLSLDGSKLDAYPSTYTVPDGVDQIVATYQRSTTAASAYITSYTTAPVLNPTVTAGVINSIVSGNAGGGTGGSESTTVVTTRKEESILATADSLPAGEYITFPENHVMNKKTLTLSFDVSTLSDTDVIRLGHGETNYGGNYIELTSTKLSVYSYIQSASLVKSQNHGLTVSDYVNITINVDVYTADICVTTPSGTFRINDVSWSGRNGQVFAVSTKSTIKNVKMRWTCTALTSDYWLFGDSYFNCTYAGRWPYYLVQDGVTDVLFTGYPGRACAAALAEFKVLLELGTPKYAIWCMGMNNKDSDTAINATYLATTQEFLELCEENGITPILTTIPCTPTVNNSHKNTWVKNSGYRYVDFAHAVGGEEVGSSWYDGMLHTDLVHPDTLGAEALYYQFIADFPEIFD